MEGTMTYTFGQIRKASRVNGWMKVRQTGSHEIYRHTARSGIVVVAGRDAEPVAHGTLNSILRQSGLKKEDL
jgi:predicted RNA binding protein YcfA (HicA-like mRNA interferase family)